jgi:hypothetical protein
LYQCPFARWVLAHCQDEHTLYSRWPRKRTGVSIYLSIYLEIPHHILSFQVSRLEFKCESYGRQRQWFSFSLDDHIDLSMVLIDELKMWFGIIEHMLQSHHKKWLFGVHTKLLTLPHTLNISVQIRKVTT